MRCNRCGIVFDGDVSLFTACLNAKCGATDSFTLVGQWPGLEPKQDRFAALQLGFRALAQEIVSQNRTQVTGTMKINYKDQKGNLTPKIEVKSRDLSEALTRIAQGGPLPNDVNKHEHFHDGGKYHNNDGGLPVTGGNYYTEFGVHSSSRGWEVRLSSERIVIGKCLDIYYNPSHYEKGAWWVFNTANGSWSPYARA